jgi:hypothetical protein
MDPVKKHADSRAAASALRQATRGLLYMSESDEPFKVVQVGELAGAFGAADACLVARRPADSLVRQQGIEEFFGELVQERDWYGPSEIKDARRYQALWHYFRDSLAGATVFRVGELQVDIIIAGRASDGHWVGVKTRAIET